RGRNVVAARGAAAGAPGDGADAAGTALLAAEALGATAAGAFAERAAAPQPNKKKTESRAGVGVRPVRRITVSHNRFFTRIDLV
ncbi:MAG TPA: hypothetical protein VHW01_23220, partial [Polyangiaceae bacterium]|nr:hypothetical protein [Polyangiaceae bacterium]